MTSNNKSLRELPILGNIPLDWEVRKFGEILEDGTRNGVYKTKEFHGRGSKIVNMGELFKYPRLKSIPMKRIELSDSELQKSSLKEGDLLFARRSLVAEGTGKCSIVKEVTDPTVFESSIIRARPDQKIIDPDFLYYLFSSAYGVYILGSIRRQVAVAGITGSDLVTLPIPVPPLNYQIAVAKLLSYFDDKIHTNQLINLKLEKITQTIFKSWFVDFDPVHAKKIALEKGLSKEQSERAAMAIISGICSPSDFVENFKEMDQHFTQKLSKMNKEHQEELIHTASLFPSEFEDSELGDVPRKWKVTELKERIEFNPKLSLKKFNIAKYIDMKALPTSGHRVNTLMQKEFKSGSKFQNGDVLMARITPCLENGKTAYSDCLEKNEVAWGSTEFIVMHPKKNTTPNHWVYLLSRYSTFVQFAIANMSGTSGRQRVPASLLGSFKFVFCDDEFLKKFGELSLPFFEKIKLNSVETSNLEKLRDTLLPKLQISNLIENWNQHE